MLRHLNETHPQVGASAVNYISIQPFIEIRAFRGYLRTYRHRRNPTPSHNVMPQEYFSSVKNALKNVIQINMAAGKSMKVQITLLGEFIRGEITSSSHESCTHYINSKQRIVGNIHVFSEFFGEILNDITSVVDIFEEFGSGWKFSQSLGSDVRLAKYMPRRGRCHVIITPRLTHSRAVVNVKNNDDFCFKWAFLSISHYEQVKSHRNRPSQYKKYEKEYNWKGISFPADLRSVIKFELQNSTKRLAINVFECSSNDNDINVLRISPNVTKPVATVKS